MILMKGWSIEVYRLEGSTFFDCSHSLKSPKDLQGVTGGIVTGPDNDLLLVVCGGIDMDTGLANDKCFSLSSSSNTDKEQISSLYVAREGSATIGINGGKSLWVTGGIMDLHPIHPTEMVMLNDLTDITTVDGPKLPVSLSHHCLEKVGDNTAILIGGQDFDSLFGRRTWTANLSGSLTPTWNQLSSLNIGRRMHACGVIKDSTLSDHSVVIAAGGEIGLSVLTSSVELLLLVQGKLEVSWETGQDMPDDVSNAARAITPDQQKMLVLGDSSMFQMQCSGLQCEWIKLDKELRRSFVNGLAMIWPANSLNFSGEIQPPCGLLDPKRGTLALINDITYNGIELVILQRLVYSFSSLEAMACTRPGKQRQLHFMTGMEHT